MSYLVLARKYRPQTFDDVVQQSHVTKTLSHAIMADRVAHALLFTGPRGTGKTTIARIVAKALNCIQGPTPSPCNQCDSCIEITNGNAADVFEIDGASNNSVDQIRELRENIPYMPSRSRYKIYIIDEVHMLSLAAFNALLKTLEEPPAHILFLFATTEPHKIPITILSRCQRHDMRRIGASAISEHLAALCRKEGFELPADVLTMVAREAGGSMRDALSLLDQILSCSDETVSYDQVLSLLGLVDRKVVFDLASAVLNGNLEVILDILADSYHRGQDLRKLYGEILDHFRNLLIVGIGHNIENLVDLPLQEIDLLRQQGATISPAALSQLFDFLFKEESTVRFASQPKLAVEMVFFRLLSMRPILSIDELVLKLDALRSGLPEEPPGMVVKAAANDSMLRKKEAAKEKSVVSIAPVVEKREPPKAEPALQEAPETVKMAAIPLQGLKSADAPVVEKQNIEKQDVEAKDQGLPENKKPDNLKNDDADDHSQMDDGMPVQDDRLWTELLKLIRNQKPSLGSVLSNCRLIEIRDNCLKIEIDDNGYVIGLIKKNLPQLNQWCRQLAGRAIDLNLVTKGDPGKEKPDKKKQAAHLKNDALSHPVVLDAIEVFNGKVAEVKILSGGNET